MSKTDLNRVIVGVLCMVLAGASQADAMTHANWDLASATDSARSVDSRSVESELMSLTVAGDTTATLALLRNTSERTDWPVPAREAALYRFIQTVRQLPAGSVAPEVLGWLRDYTPQTLVPLEDHPDHGVPLFNLRGAVAGVQNQWRQESAVARARELLDQGPERLLESYLLQTDPAIRRGYVQAIDDASPSRIRALTLLAIETLPNQPELTPLAGQAALKAGDLEALESVLAVGAGAGLAPLMQAAGKRFSETQYITLLRQVARDGAPLNAALAIAELDKTKIQDSDYTHSLMDRLGDPDTGAAAALALARQATPEIVDALTGLSHSSNALVASRARLALELSESGVLGEQP